MSAAVATLSHNLNGQRLGRKGRDTRDRIIAAAAEVVAQAQPTQVSLSAIAREAGMGMTSLYAYFGDLSELLLAVLGPAMAEAEAAYLAHARIRWTDAELGEQCSAFIGRFHRFWQRHSAILHLRNTLADQKDLRMRNHRITAAQAVIALIVEQMDRNREERGTPATAMATVLYMGFERAINIATDAHFGDDMPASYSPDIAHNLEAEAQLLEFGIRKYRG